MPGLIRSLLGLIVLVVTIGLATCQSMVRAEPAVSDHSVKVDSTTRSQAE